MAADPFAQRLGSDPVPSREGDRRRRVSLGLLHAVVDEQEERLDTHVGDVARLGHQADERLRPYQFGEDLGVDPKGVGELPGVRISYKENGDGEERLIASAQDLMTALDMPRQRAAANDGLLITVSTAL